MIWYRSAPGFLCEARSGRSLAAAIQRFLALSPAERRKMGDSAREKVVQEFSEEKVIGAYIKLLDELAGSRVR